MGNTSAAVYLSFCSIGLRQGPQNQQQAALDISVSEFTLDLGGPGYGDGRLEGSRNIYCHFLLFSYKLTDKGLEILKSSLCLSVREAVKLLTVHVRSWKRAAMGIEKGPLVWYFKIKVRNCSST